MRFLYWLHFFAVVFEETKNHNQIRIFLEDVSATTCLFEFKISSYQFNFLDSCCSFSIQEI